MAKKKSATKSAPARGGVPQKVRAYLLSTGTPPAGVSTVWRELDENGRKDLTARAESAKVAKRKPRGVTTRKKADAEQPTQPD